MAGGFKLEAGRLTIDVGRPGPVFDALSGTKLGDGPRLPVEGRLAQPVVLSLGAPLTKP